MVKLNIVFSFVLVILSIFSFIIIYFSIDFYTFNSGVKLSGHSSSEANLGVFIEYSTGICGDSMCNSNETCSSCAFDCGNCSLPPSSSTSTSGSTSGSTSSGGSSGGSGGSATTTRLPDFRLSNQSVNVKMVSGDSKTYEIVIENTGTAILDLDVVVIGVQDSISFDSDSIYILPGKNSSFNFTIFAPEPGVYAGKIFFNYQGIIKDVAILLNVVSEGVLFDLTATVPELYRILRPGQKLPVSVEISELGEKEGMDVKVIYIIRDFNGNTYYTESDDIFVFGSKRYNKRFSTEGLEPRDYVLGIELIYEGGFAASSAQFRVSDSFLTLQTWIAILAFVIALIVLFWLIIFFKRHKEDEENKLNSKFGRIR